jgi:3-dehydroquinate synthase
MTTPPPAGGTTTVTVALRERTYDVIIGRGVVASLGARIAARVPGAKAAIVADETVAHLHLPTVAAALKDAGIPVSVVTVPPGEGSKCFAQFERVCEALVAAKIERDDVVVALGGGVVGDLTGFAASVVRRGVDFVQVPTSLLAQVDSSVGGKTAINLREGKNLVGAFHQPMLVLADTALLDTLPRREFSAGYAEVVKYGLLGDAAFFDWLEDNIDAVMAGEGGTREYAIAACCRMKADIVARDEREIGDRALLNFGHTFGHAFEAAAGFSQKLLHGEAVSLGCVLAFEFSRRLGISSGNEVGRVARHFAAAGLPTRIGDLVGPLPGVDRLMELIAQDKKVRRGTLTFILARRIGETFVAHDVDPAQVRAFLAAKLEDQ